MTLAEAMTVAKREAQNQRRIQLVTVVHGVFAVISLRNYCQRIDGEIVARCEYISGDFPMRYTTYDRNRRVHREAAG